MLLGNGRVIGSFISQALRGEPITVYGDGENQRSFLFIDDLVTGILGRMESEELRFGLLNLGSHEVVSLHELAKKIINLTNSSSELKFYPAPSSSAKALVPNIELARELIAWEPQVGLDEGLNLTIESFLNAPANR